MKSTPASTVTRVSALLLLVVAATVLDVASAVPVADTPLPGFRTTFTESGLQNFESAFIAFVNQEFATLTLPDQHLQPSLPIVGVVDVDLTDIRISGFHIPNATFGVVAPNIVTTGVQGTGLRVDAEYALTQQSWPHISTTGNVTAIPGQGDLSTSVAITVVNGLPWTTATAVDVNFDKLTITFSGHAIYDWLLDLFALIFSGTLKGDIDSAVASAMQSIVNITLNTELQKIPTEVFVGSEGSVSALNLDIATTAVDAATGQYLALSNAFGVADNRTGIPCPIASESLPYVDPQQPHQLQLFISASFLNCALWVPFANGAFQAVLPSSVAFWAEFIAQLNQLYFGLNMTSTLAPLHPLQSPAVTLKPSGMAGSYAMTLNQSVIVGTPHPSSSVWTDTLQIDIDFGLVLWIAPSAKVNNTNALFGQVTDFGVAVNAVATAIGPIDLTDLQLILGVAEPIITSELNALLGGGLPLPVIPGIALVNPQLVFGAGYLGVASDFKFGATLFDVNTDPLEPEAGL